jgi:hypothetical protein
MIKFKYVYVILAHNHIIPNCIPERYFTIHILQYLVVIRHSNYYNVFRTEKNVIFFAKFKRQSRYLPGIFYGLVCAKKINTSNSLIKRQ